MGQTYRGQRATWWSARKRRAGRFKRISGGVAASGARMSRRTSLGPSHNVARMRLEGDPIHDPNAPHPLSIAFCPGSAQVFGSPLRYGDGRGTIGPHEPVANEAGLRAEDGNSVGVNLMEDAFRFRRVEIDVPVSDGHPQISRRDGLLFHL
jgi:hypothetical protein